MLAVPSQFARALILLLVLVLAVWELIRLRRNKRKDWTHRLGILNGSIIWIGSAAKRSSDRLSCTASASPPLKCVSTTERA